MSGLEAGIEGNKKRMYLPRGHNIEDIGMFDFGLCQTSLLLKSSLYENEY